MDRVVMPRPAEICMPGLDASVGSATRHHARSRNAALKVVARGRPPTTSLRACGSNPYVSRRPTALLAALAVLATALALSIMVALPWWLATAVSTYADSPRASNISELAALQRDSLLAAACWGHACAMPDKRRT